MVKGSGKKKMEIGMRHILTAIFILLSTLVKAQNTLYGIIVNEKQEPIEFALVTVTEDEHDERPLTGMITEGDGYYEFYKLPTRKYYIHVTAFGYQSNLTKIDVITSEQELPFIVLKKEVNDTFSLKGTGKFNVKKNTLIFESNRYYDGKPLKGIDILSQLPNVTIENGKVIMLGNNVTLLLNGKKKKSSEEIIKEFESINLDRVKKIETKYGLIQDLHDDYKSSQINIDLLPNPEKGLSLGASVGGLYNPDLEKARINSFVILNNKSKYIDFNIEAKMLYSVRNYSDITERIYFYNADFTNAREKGTGDYNSYTFQINDQFDLKLSKNDKISFTKNFIRRNFEPNLNLNWTFENNSEITNSLAFRNYSYLDYDLQTTNINYNRILRNSGHILLNYELKENDRLNRFYFYKGGNVTNLFKTESNGTSHLIRLNIKTAINNINQIEIDVVRSKRDQQLDFQSTLYYSLTVPVDIFNSNFRYYNEFRNSGFFLFHGKSNNVSILKYNYYVGLNVIQNESSGEFSKTDTSFFKIPILKVLPTASFATQISKNDSLVINYRSGIQEATFLQLQPIIDLSDLLYQFKGNPYLRPETRHNLTMSYGRQFRSRNILATAFFRNTQDAILPYTRQDTSIALITTLENIQSVTKLGLEYNYRFKNTDWWDVELDMTTYLTNMKDKNLDDLRPNLFTGCAKITYNLIPWKKGKFQLFANYSSPMPLPQGRTNHVYFMDLSLSHMILKGRGRISLVCTDIFDTQSQGVTIKGREFTNSHSLKLDTKSIMLNFGYTFRAKFYEQMINHKFDNIAPIYPIIQ